MHLYFTITVICIIDTNDNIYEDSFKKKIEFNV